MGTNIQNVRTPPNAIETCTQTAETSQNALVAVLEADSENFKITGFRCRLQASDHHSESSQRSEFKAAASDARLTMLLHISSFSLDSSTFRKYVFTFRDERLEIVSD